MAGAKKNDVSYLDLSKNHINADHLVGDPDLKGKIAHVHRLFPQVKKDAIAKILLCCDNNLASAITKLSSGESAKEALDEWEVAKGKGRGRTAASSGGKRSKKGSVRVLNGNGASAEVLSVPLSNGVCESDSEEGKRNGHYTNTGALSRSVSTSPVAGAPRGTQTTANTRQKSSTSQPAPLPQRTRKRRGMQAPGATIPQNSSRAEHVTGSSSATSSSKQQDAASRKPAETTVLPSQPVETQKEPSLHRESGKKKEELPPNPAESSAVSSAQGDRGRLDSTASTSSVGGAGGGDSVKRLLKDITRCHVSLARHQTNLQERCDVSSRLIHQTFAQLRAAVDQREQCLVEQLERVRSSAGKMLEERQETSAHLKVLGEQLLSHARELDSNQIRAQMKAFVSDRKVDEEIGSVSRFQADPDQLIQQISIFGKINSISHTYTAWCAGQVIVSPSLITLVSNGPQPPSSTTPTSPADTNPVTVAQSSGTEDGRKQVGQEKTTKLTLAAKQPNHPPQKEASPVSPPPPEPCSPDELRARQERVKASLLAQGVVLYPPLGEMVPSKKSVKRDRKRRNAQRTQEHGPAAESSVKESVHLPNTKSHNSADDKPPSSFSKPQVGSKPEAPSTPSAPPAEKTTEKKGGGLASGQGSKVIPPSRDYQKGSSAPQSRPRSGAHYEQSVIIVHNRARSGRGPKSRQQPRPATDSSRGGQTRQPREDRKRVVRASKQQPATSKSHPPATNDTEGRPSETEGPKTRQEAAVPAEMQDVVVPAKPQEAVVPGEEQEAVVLAQPQETVVRSKEQEVVIPAEPHEAVVPDKGQEVIVPAEPQERGDHGSQPTTGGATSVCNSLTGQTPTGHADLPCSEERAAQKTAAQETAAQETAVQETATKETATQETAAQETATQETAAQETATQETATQETAAQETATQETATQETAAQETAAQEMAAQETDELETAELGLTAQETTAQETAAQETAAQETAAQETAAQETAAQETAAQETAAQETAAQETTAQETTALETAALETAAQETQSEEITFMNVSTNSEEPADKEQQKLTRKQSVRVTPSPEPVEAPLAAENDPEEVISRLSLK